MVPDTRTQASPLERRYLIGVFRVSNGNPVDGAQVVIQGDMPIMPGLHPVRRLPLEPEGTPGVYAGVVRFPMPGPWILRIQVSGPVTGIVDILEQVGRTPPGSLPLGGASVFTRRNVLNLSARGIHLLGAAIWIGGLAFLSVLSLRRSEPALPLENVSWILLGWNGLGLIVLLLTGVYNLLFNTPPGRLITPDDLREMLEGPYGKPYVALLIFKLSCFGALLSLAVVSLLRGRGAVTSGWLRINVALGLLALAAGGVLGYLHILTHGHSF
ncbi:MAG: FixH family protein [Candidatus Rokubacteria bacterium]|nr:FixH family protein [Candidatus Rokubacteria bacterium]